MNVLKKIPERTCIGCNETKPKKELLRVVKDKENNITIDLTGKKNGRGAYICPSVECLEKAVKANRLSKIFEQNIDKEIYEDLRDVIVNQSK